MLKTENGERGVLKMDKRYPLPDAIAAELVKDGAAEYADEAGSTAPRTAT